MKFGRLTIGLAGWLCPAMMLGAAELAANDNPYTPIITRNIFGLVPIPTNAPVDVNANATPPPKITANGIMTIFGNKEALFKVAVPPKPGQPAADLSYVLSEGESQDDIAVVKIDDEADVITFNNHGTIQALPLTAAPNINTPVPGPISGIPVPNAGGHFPRPFGGVGFGGRRNVPAAQASSAASDNSSTPNQQQANTEGASSGVINNNSNINPEYQGLSPEAQALLIENNYNQAKAKGDPTAPLFPQTPLRGQSDGDTGTGGAEPPAP